MFEILFAYFTEFSLFHGLNTLCYSETACQEILQLTVANLLTFENQVYVSPEKEWLF